MIETPNGWTASRDPDVIGVKTFAIVGTDETIRLRADVAPLLLYWLHRFNAEVEALQGPQLDDWGYSYRANKNDPSLLSEHSAGTAVDANAIQHPNGTRGTFSPVQVSRIHGILAAINRVAKVMEWGGDFVHTADEMHVDLVGDLDQVRAVIARLHIQPDGTVSVPKPPPPPKPAPVKENDMRYVLPKGTPDVKAGQQVRILEGKQVYLNSSGGLEAMPLETPDTTTVANYAEAFGPIVGTPNP